MAKEKSRASSRTTRLAGDAKRMAGSSQGAYEVALGPGFMPDQIGEIGLRDGGHDPLAEPPGLVG